MSLKDKIKEEEDLVKSLAYSMAIKKGVKNKSFGYYYVFESQFGSFSDNMDTLVNRIIRLQGNDLSVWRKEVKAEILSEIFPLDTDRLLIIVMCCE